MTLNLPKTVFLTAVCIIFLQTAIFAIPLSQYKSDVGKASEVFYNALYDEEGDLKTDNETEKLQAVSQVRRLLPPGQTVKFGNTSVEANNNLLHDKLKSFESETDSIRQLKIAQEISEHLAQIETKIEELEKQNVAARSKDEDRQNLREILSRPEYQKPEQKKENWILKAIKEFLEWIANLFPRPNFGTPSGEGLSAISSGLQIIILLAVFAIIGFLLYRFAPVLFKKFNRKEKRDKKSRVILGETIAADETSENLFGEAENLARAGDLRGAIRKGYIAFLCELSDRKIIGLARHKTNRDYLRDVRSRENLYQNMHGLTASFERHWYGFDQTDKTDWEEFKRAYSETVSKV